MSKLLYKWRQNENDVGISLYPIYSPKLDENILKHYWLNLSKEITMGFNDALRTTLEFPASIFDASLV